MLLKEIDSEFPPVISPEKTKVEISPDGKKITVIFSELWMNRLSEYVA